MDEEISRNDGAHTIMTIAVIVRGETTAGTRVMSERWLRIFLVMTELTASVLLHFLDCLFHADEVLVVQPQGQNIPRAFLSLGSGLQSSACELIIKVWLVGQYKFQFVNWIILLTNISFNL